VVIDVREPYEAGICSIGGELIPEGIITESLDRIPRDVEVVVHCRSGVRSARAIRLLEDAHGFNNLLNLRGGILAWQEEVEPELARY
jgi:adenylyltransferase/sulfurtransferase